MRTMLSRSPSSRLRSFSGELSRARQPPDLRRASIALNLQLKHRHSVSPAQSGRQTRQSPSDSRRKPIRTASSQQLIQDHSERIHVAGRRHRLSRDLFRAGIAGGQQANGGEGCVRLTLKLNLENLRNAKVEKLWHTVGSDKNVPWFYVAMDNQALVSILDCRAHLHEEL